MTKKISIYLIKFYLALIIPLFLVVSYSIETTDTSGFMGGLNILGPIMLYGGIAIIFSMIVCFFITRKVINENFFIISDSEFSKIKNKLFYYNILLMLLYNIFLSFNIILYIIVPFFVTYLVNKMILKNLLISKDMIIDFLKKLFYVLVLGAIINFLISIASNQETLSIGMQTFTSLMFIATSFSIILPSQVVSLMLINDKNVKIVPQNNI
jgi:hypothetical protein